MDETEYERQRRENILANQALLDELDLQNASSSLGIKRSSSPASSTKSNKRPKPAPKKRAPAAPVVKERVQPTRRSARTLNVPPEEKEAMKRKWEEEAAAEAAAQAEAARAHKRAKHGDYTLAALLSGSPTTYVAPTATAVEVKRGSSLATPASDSLPTPPPTSPTAAAAPETTPDNDESALLETLKGLALAPHARRVPTPEDAEENSMPESLQKLKDDLKGMKPAAFAKVTNERVYTMQMHPVKEKDIVFVGDKNGQVGIWDVSAAPATEEEEETREGRVWRIQAHAKSSISCMKFDPSRSNSLLTSSYDCTLRSLDFETGRSTEVFRTMDADGSKSDVLISHFDISPAAPHSLWATDNAGGLSLRDLRVPLTENRGRRWEISDNKVGGCSVNPVRPELVLTSSNDRTVKIWDTRNLQRMPAPAVELRGEEEEPELPTIDWEAVEPWIKKEKSTLKASFEHGKSASSAYWDPSGRRVVSTSYDDTLRIWDLNAQALALPGALKSFKPKTVIPHDNQTGRWLTILRAQWAPHAHTFPHFTVGSMKRQLEVWSATGELLASLYDPDLVTAVPAVTCGKEGQVGRVAGGNASGRCVLWSTGRAE